MLASITGPKLSLPQRLATSAPFEDCVKINQADVASMAWRLTSTRREMSISTQVEDLLDDGAIHANAQDYDGRRPLHLAAGEEHLEVVTLLLSRGADPGVRDRV